ERACERFAGDISNAQLVRFRNQLLENHRAMAKRLGACEVFFANAVRVNERLGGVHADGERAEQFRYRLAFSLSEELSRGGGVIGDEGARYTQTGACGEPELALFVLGVALAVDIVYPASLVERVEKTIE